MAAVAAVAATPEKKKAVSSAASANGGLARQILALTAHYQRCVTEVGGTALLVQDVTKLKCRAEMKDILDNMLIAESPDQLKALVDAWIESCAQIKQLLFSITKAGVSLKDHIKFKAGEQTRDTRKQATDAAKKVEDAARKKAKEAADALKADAEKVAPLFTLDFAAMVLQGIMTSIPAKGAANTIVTAAPCIIRDLQAVKDVDKMPAAQVTLGNFGGSYKKGSDLEG